MGHKKYLFVLLVCVLWHPFPGLSRDGTPATYVNPLLGTDSRYEFSHGNTYPGITLPWGMACWTPQTGARESGWMYTYDTHALNGFKLTHQPSPWVGDYGDFSIMPMTGDLNLAFTDRASVFSHDREEAHPYYYRVFLDRYHTQVEITPTTRGGIMRFTFPETDQAFILLDAHPRGTSITLDPERGKISGYTRANRGSVPENFACYFVAYLDAPVAGYGVLTEDGRREGRETAAGDHVAGYLRLRTAEDQPVTLRIGTSFISLEQAERNLKREIGDRSFNEVRAQAEQTWNEKLNRIRIEGATDAQRTTFYTAFYRALAFPRIWYEYNDQNTPYHFSPYDGKIHEGVLYADNGFWDTFRAVYPFYTLLFPEQDAEIVRGWINAYREGGWFPKWTSPGYRNIMIGTHVESLVADAYAKGIRDFDVDTAYQAMVKDGTIPTDFGGYGRVGLEPYLNLGYVPADQIREATARTLEFAYDDFCIARMAQALGHREDYRIFAPRAMNYRNVFDSSVGFMRGRLSDGRWEPDFDPIRWGGPFTEGSAWHYSWSVMQDVAGLIDLMGGKPAFIQKLDAMLTTPPNFKIGSYGQVIHEMTEMTAGHMGQYAHGNEPVHHVLYLYDFAGQPWKAQRAIRKVVTTLYGPGPAGLLGDEDNGQMSAWYLFSSLGFYPVTPGVPQYVIGSPLFTKATLSLANGKQLIISAPENSDENVYIRSVTFNGKEYNKPWLSHSDLQ